MDHSNLSSTNRSTAASRGREAGNVRLAILVMFVVAGVGACVWLFQRSSAKPAPAASVASEASAVDPAADPDVAPVPPPTGGSDEQARPVTNAGTKLLPTAMILDARGDESKMGALVEQWRGRTFRVSGKCAGVRPTDDQSGLLLAVRTSRDDVPVMALFPLTSGQELSHLESGSTVVLEGDFESFFDLSGATMLARSRLISPAGQ